MSLPALQGRDRLTEAVAAAFRRSELPRVLLFYGRRGVGKQRLSLWIAQLLLCEPSSAPVPCGECRGCRMLLRLEHPDLLWYRPIKRPTGAGSREREGQAHEDARLDLLAQIRRDPLRPSYSEEVLGIHIAAVRNLRKETTRRPGMAARRVFVVAEAQELVSQEDNPQAANVLLKVLEEPPNDCWFLLTSSEPGRVLPTIRSRAAGVFVPPLSEAEVRAFLTRHVEATEEAIRTAAGLSEGSIGRALGFLPTDEGPGPLERIREEARRLVSAALSPRRYDRFTQALNYPPTGARGLHATLSALESWLRDLAALAASERAPVLNQDARGWLLKTLSEEPVAPQRIAACIRYVEDARDFASDNVNPQLILSGLLADLHGSLQSPQLRVPKEIA